MTIRFAEIARRSATNAKGGMSLAKAIGIGVGAARGAALGAHRLTLLVADYARLTIDVISAPNCVVPLPAAC